MGPYHNRLKTPEEIELLKKREELSRFQWNLAELEQSYATLKAEIRQFEQHYEALLGARIRILEDLEWQLKGLLGNDDIVSDADSVEFEETVSNFHHRTDLLDDDDTPVPDEPQKRLKSLYREVAKAIHPDLASDEEDRLRRQELMTIANQAYGMGDRAALEDILCDWELGPEPGPATDIALELVRVIRLIARVQQNIHAVIRQIEELKTTDIYGFMLRIDETTVDGINLMAEMAAKVDLDIIKTRQQLAALRGEVDTQVQHSSPALATRLLRFPVDQVCGILYERSAGSVDYRDWQRLGNARGVREVLLDKAVRLDVKGKGGAGMHFLDALLPDDLQALFLYDIDDSALEHLKHFSGLNELYLSNTTVSDKGLHLLDALRGLRRLSIYHTAISDAGLDNLALLKELKWLTCSGTRVTDEGLERFRRQVPGCKAVNFEWRYGK
jgi:hypothetical protein